MQLQNTFNIPVGLEEAFAVLLDPARVAAAMPGATLLEGASGESLRGQVKVKVGPVLLTYNGTAEFGEIDHEAGTLAMRARGKDGKGGGAEASVALKLAPAGPSHTEVNVTTELNVSGRAAQFGQGVLADVSERLTAEFAKNLARSVLSRTEGADDLPPAREGATAPESAPTSVAGTTQVDAPAPESAEAIDLLGLGAGPLLRRLAPVGVGVLIGLVLALLLRRRR